MRRKPRVALAALVACALLALGGPARAGTANAGLPGAPAGNPLAHMDWGTYTGPIDGVYPAYAGSSGRTRQLLGKIALRPLAYWFGPWYSDTYAATVAEQYVGNVTAGDPNALAQVTIFRLDPWEDAACSAAFGPAGQASYRAWIDGFAAGIGSRRAAVVLQPDLPFSLCARSRAPLDLVAYAARRFNSLPHTTVYIDAGAAEWKPVSQVVRMLIRAGIGGVRGFALNTTQYDTTSRELEFGAQIVRGLQGSGIRGKHFVLNTAMNGAGFLNGQYHGDVANARVCRNTLDHLCATLGIPPTWDVANRRWHLSHLDASIASRFADAYLWIGRPWMIDQAGPFDVRRAAGLAASSPF